MVGHQTLNLAIGVRVPASQPTFSRRERAVIHDGRLFCLPLQFALLSIGGETNKAPLPSTRITGE